jgi:hypothetical protein
MKLGIMFRHGARIAQMTEPRRTIITSRQEIELGDHLGFMFLLGLVVVVCTTAWYY